MIGTPLFQYRIVSSIGAGGMGEVFLAHDTRLDRKVAIKILPKAFATDADRLRRFEQESRTLAALNHPNILTVHDAAVLDGTPFLVTELLEGRTLRQELADGALPPRQATALALQIAQGLAAAHGKGIVHRDLKPENLFVTKDGRIKILDFGLAKLRDPCEPTGSAPVEAADPEASTRIGPGTPPPSTEAGRVLGTPSYMAPEQVRGDPADHRADLFALGCVLYEMLSGSRAFRRDTPIECMNAVLKEEPPDLHELDPALAPALVRVVAKCLAKIPDERWQTAKDLGDELHWIQQTGTQTALRRPGKAQRPTWLVRASLGALLLVLAASVAINFSLWPRPKPAAGVSRFSVPIDLPLHMAVANVVISPDGRHLAFTTFDKTAGQWKLWLRRLDRLAPAVLQENAEFPFWSPDSRFVGFFADRKLKVMSVAGGPARTLCDAEAGYGGSWSRTGDILFAPGRNNGLYHIPASGGTMRPVTTLATNTTGLAQRDFSHRFPQFLPDGRHFLYLCRRNDPALSAIHIASSDGGPPIELLESRTRAELTEDRYLLFWQQDTLLAQPFDPANFKLTGERVPIAEEVQVFVDGEAKFSASTNGILAYLRNEASLDRQLTWVDRTGRTIERLPIRSADGFENFALSPDERRLALSRRLPGDSPLQIWLLDNPKAAPARFTAAEHHAWNPLWMPDGRSVVYAGRRGGQFHLYRKETDGSTDETMLLHDENPVMRLKVPSDISPDGRHLLYYQADTVWRLWYAALEGEPRPVPLTRNPGGDSCGVISPDGRWVAYTSSESGSAQVYVSGFPRGDRIWRISESVGFHPRWSGNGRELFFIETHSGGKRLMAVDVKLAPEFAHGTPHPLFDLEIDHQDMRASYQPSRDGQRFLYYKPVETTNSAPSHPLTLVLNWNNAPELQGPKSRR